MSGLIDESIKYIHYISALDGNYKFNFTLGEDLNFELPESASSSIHDQ